MMNGVAPMMGQAFNGVMPSGANAGLAGGQMPTPPQGSGIPDLGGSPGLAGSRGFAHGGAAVKTFKGPIVSSVPGRTDKHFTHVPSGSFVIPADIVSAHGEGNTLAGMETLQKLFKMGTHANLSKVPFAAHGKKYAEGGTVDEHVNKPVPVKLAGGEIVVPPENVHETMQRISKRKLTLDQSHQIMDQWVIDQRKKLRKTLAKLPGPAKD